MTRILDCNINRVCEGYRVLEDIFRFKFKCEPVTRKLKKLRHSIRDGYKDYDIELLENRDSISDFGPSMTTEMKLENDINLKSLISRNFKRVQEGLRSLEEISKCSPERPQVDFEQLRYQTYSIEKEIISYISQKKFTLPPLYGITYLESSAGRSNIEVVKEMIKAGIKIIQYREKNLSITEKFLECIEIRKLTKEAGILFIINDHVDIALLVDADGVHIGQDDLPVKEVRKLLGFNKIIGLSTHSPEQAKIAIKSGVDYIGVGPIFSTKTKVNVCDPVGYTYLEWVVENTDIPFVAIGGIKEHNLHEIIKRGATSVAIVSEITSSLRIQDKVSGLMKIIKEKYNEV